MKKVLTCSALLLVIIILLSSCGIAIIKMPSDEGLALIKGMGLDEAMPENFHIIEVGPNYKAEIWYCSWKTLIVVEGDLKIDFDIPEETDTDNETTEDIILNDEDAPVEDTTENETEVPAEKNIYKIQVEKVSDGYKLFIMDNGSNILTTNITEEKFNEFRQEIIDEYFRKVLPEDEYSIVEIKKGPKTLVVDYETEDGLVNLQIDHINSRLKEYTLTEDDDVIAYTYKYYDDTPEDFPAFH